MRRRRTTLAVTAAIVATAITSAACRDDAPRVARGVTSTMSTITITTDDELAAGLQLLAETGASGSLADLTDFDWDVVHVFAEGATREEIEGAAGDPVIRDTRYYDAGNLLVFTAGGEVVKAVSVVPDLLVVDQPTWSRRVRLEPVGDAVPALLRLVEP